MINSYSLISNTYFFTGREYEAESGLYYYRARHYSPVFGRFLQRDPIGIWEDETNLGNGYSYVGNNGVNWTDAMGLYVYKNISDTKLPDVPPSKCVILQKDWSDHFKECWIRELKEIYNDDNWIDDLFCIAGWAGCYGEIILYCAVEATQEVIKHDNVEIKRRSE